MYITRKVSIWTFVLVMVSVLAIYSASVYISWDRTLSDRELEVRAVSELLDHQLQPIILEILNDERLTKERKVQKINSELQPWINSITASYPHFGAGYYIKELESIVAFGPNFNKEGLIDISDNSEVREVYETHQNKIFQNYSQTRQGLVIANIHPIIREGEVIGHSWANVLFDDIFAMFKRELQLLLLFLAIMLVITTFGTRLITKQFVKSLSLFKNLILNDEPLPNKVRFNQDLKEVYDAYRNSRNALVESNKRFQDVVNSFDEFVWETDTNFKYKYLSKRVYEILGYKPKELIGKSKMDLILSENRKEVEAIFKKAIANKKGFRNVTVKKQAKDGRKVHLSLNALILFDEHGNVTGFRGATRDISIQKKHEADIQQLAYFDRLTGLPNRTSLQIKLNEIVQQDEEFAFLFIDLDQLKTINDTLGHNVGDELIRIIALRLKNSIAPHDFIYRFGGDEFIIILHNVESKEQIQQRANKLLETASTPIPLNNQPYYSSVSIGISLFKEHANTAESLIRYADLAMHKAKKLGKNQYVFFDKTLDDQVGEQFEISNLFVEALKNGHFQLYYQPQVSIYDHSITGIEALLRWHHPIKGYISPVKFISYAEENGFIVQLGHFILTEACKQRMQWLEEGLKDIRVAVNISLKQFQQDNFVNQVISVLETTGLDGRYLELEITESVAMDSPEIVIQKLNELRKYGINIAIDDFGMGYSSLNYLKRLPIQKLKIDRSFVQDIDQPNDYAITKSIISMAESLALSVVAEGVESTLQAEILRELHCDMIQGYLYYKPMSPKEISKIIQQKNIDS